MMKENVVHHLIDQAYSPAAPDFASGCENLRKKLIIGRNLFFAGLKRLSGPARFKRAQISMDKTIWLVSH